VGQGQLCSMPGQFCGGCPSPIDRSSSAADDPAHSICTTIPASAYTTGGYMSYLLTTLSVDPPVQLAPVPEPSVLATLLLGLGGLAWRHRRRA
jgi:hypothetical protein